MQRQATCFRKMYENLATLMLDLPPTTLLKAMFEEAKESYFNSLDRLASSILIGHFPDEEMRQHSTVDSAPQRLINAYDAENALFQRRGKPKYNRIEAQR